MSRRHILSLRLLSIYDLDFCRLYGHIAELKPSMYSTHHKLDMNNLHQKKMKQEFALRDAQYAFLLH